MNNVLVYGKTNHSKMSYKETDEVFWFAPAHTVIEQGESFMNLYGRTAQYAPINP